MSQYFPQPYEYSGENVKVELDPVMQQKLI